MARRRSPRRQTVHIVDLHSAVAEILQGYGDTIQEDAIAPSSEETAEKTVEYLETHGNYEDRTGVYRKSFRYTIVRTPRGTTSTVHSEKHQLTHLLENGHAIAGGTRRTRKFPHWKPAEKYAQEYFENKLRQKIKEVEA